MRILLAEDDLPTARVLMNGLKAEHFAADLVIDGEEALLYMSEIAYDVVVLDVAVPKLDGLAVLRRARKKHIQIPVILLSGRYTVEDCVRGLEAGADDCMAKPFAFEEFIARIRALLRRPVVLQNTLVVGDLEIDRTRHTATRAGKPIQLSQREFAVLDYLMRNAGHPVSRNMVVEHAWDVGFEGNANIVDVYINYLRTKVDHGHDQKLIHTARGFGYMLTESEQVVLSQSA